MVKFHGVESLTFVPNQYCNFGCKYCYLGDLTNNTDKHDDVCDRLKKTLDSYTESGLLIYLIMFHGAEVTTLPPKILDEMFQICTDYFRKYKMELHAFKVKPGLHIKSNIYRADKVMDILAKHNVSISASVDIPFSHHSKFRVLKNGTDTLPKIKENIKLFMEKYPRHLFHMSTTIGKYALEHVDEFIEDIEWMDSIGFDICADFYIMFIYDSVNSKIKMGMTDKEMVIFMDKLLERWKGTKFERAIYYCWFKEFTHDYCTNIMNCGGFNNLIQKNGNVYPCHRAQPDSDLLFGNINDMDMKSIKKSGRNTMRQYENNNRALSQDCMECDYFHLCNVGCPVARRDSNDNKSYTCALQLELYKRQPERFPPDKLSSARARDAYIQNMQPKVYQDKVPRIMKFNPEFMETKNGLNSIISNDKKLQSLYKSGNIKLLLNDDIPVDLISLVYEQWKLELELKSADIIKLFISDDMIDTNLEDEGIHISFLNTTQVVYGDEQRTKMMHIEDCDIPLSQLTRTNNGYIFDATEYFLRNKNNFLDGIENAFYITTISCRKHHYWKHSVNAFYHIEAINLPFHDFWFSYK